MKLFIIPLIACIISIDLRLESDFKVFTLYNRKVVIAEYLSQNDKRISTEKHRVHRYHEKRCFILEKDTVYLEYDSSPVFEEPLLPYFANRISIKQEVSPRYHIYTVCFVIDKDGSVREYGFLNGNTDKMYRMQLVQIMQSMKGRFVPAKVNGNNVCAFIYLDLDFQTDEFRESVKK